MLSKNTTFTAITNRLIFQECSKLAMVSETDMVSAAREGLPLTGHVLPSTLPNYPTLPVIESDVVSRVGGAAHIMSTMETGTGSAASLAGIYHLGEAVAAASSLSEAQVSLLILTIWVQAASCFVYISLMSDYLSEPGISW